MILNIIFVIIATIFGIAIAYALSKTADRFLDK
jgi:uncharacterized membrane protein